MRRIEVLFGGVGAAVRSTQRDRRPHRGNRRRTGPRRTVREHRCPLDESVGRLENRGQPRNAETTVAIARRIDEFPPLHPSPTRRTPVAGSGRGDRRESRRRLRCALRPVGQRRHRQPTTHRDQTRTPAPTPHHNRNRPGRSPAPKPTTTPPTRFGYPGWKRPSSTPACARITTGWSPTGNTTATPALRVDRRAGTTVSQQCRRVHESDRSRPGTPRRHVVRTASTPPSSCILNLDTDTPVASLHLGPLLTDEERQYLLCEATFEAWFQRHGQPLGAARTTRPRSAAGCAARWSTATTAAWSPAAGPPAACTPIIWCTGKTAAPTELHNLVLVCPYHHRLHHHGGITLTGPADHLVVTDRAGTPLSNGSLARPPTTPPPDVPPCRGPTGEHADWWWYPPFQPQPPPSTN